MKKNFISRICGCISALLIWASVLDAQANPYTSECDVIVGPTSDPELTEANLEWTRRVIGRLESMDVACELHFVEAWARANKMFADGIAEVLFPEIVGDWSQPGMTGMPVAMTHGFVVLTRSESALLNSLEMLKGKRIGIVRGRFYPRVLKHTPGIELEEVGSFEQNVDKLLYERIDATIEYQQDAQKLLESEGLTTRIHFGEEFGAAPLAYRFQLSKQGVHLMEQFNIAISELIAEGTYHRLFKDTSQRRLY